MDKSWVKLDRLSPEFIAGLQNFIDHSLRVASQDGLLKCPCKRCCNRDWLDPGLVRDHLYVDGMDTHYEDKLWTAHGESLPDPIFIENIDDMGGNEANGGDILDMLSDIFGNGSSTSDQFDGVQGETSNLPTEDAENFYNLLKDADTDLYPGSTKMKKLEFLVHLYQIKCLSGWTDASLSLLLPLLKRILPDGETLPENFYYAKKLIRDLGLTYQKIDACARDCMIYWKSTEQYESCTTCGLSRYEIQSVDAGHNIRKVPSKVLRYFPLIPRLQRLYMSRHTAEHMSWHATSRTNDGLMRHPADSPAWKALDMKFPLFASEMRNVRLGLASDGFNPFGHMSSSHSTWPVVMTVYNLPPWLCMKQPYMMLTLLISGPKAPGNDIDVYLAPLIDELKTLWVDGIQTYDAFTRQTFNMRAALLWTINDFPAYANLSGWSTKGKKACPQCNDETDSFWLTHGHKSCYMGHRRFLPIKHRFRRQTRDFNGKPEHRRAPVPLSGLDCLIQLSGLQFKFGKGDKEKSGSKRTCPSVYDGPWKKQSIFFDLPYWKDLLIRHNLDVMHIEKNICDSVVGTLLGVDGKSKDTLKARADLELLNIMPKLHPIRQGAKTYLPPALFTLTNAEKVMFLQVLASVRVPDSFSSNVARCVQVQQKKLVGLKSHDCHVILQQLLPVAMRCVLKKPLCMVLLELCAFFRHLCGKTSSSDTFSQLTHRIALTLCQLERIFPPAFFDVMVHLSVHLGEEAAIAGPVHYRWMYPIERYLGTLKRYVRNKSRPEGSIAEGYIAEECLSFCSMYLDDVETRRNRPSRNADKDPRSVPGGFSIFLNQGYALGGKGKLKYMDEQEWTRTSNYVLNNCHEVDPFLSNYIEQAKDNRVGRQSVWEAEQIARANFPEWFHAHVSDMRTNDPDAAHDDLFALAMGPSRWCRKYKKYVINGYRFCINSLDKKKKNQNSGVYVRASVPSYASRNDRNPVDGLNDYYGVLTDVIELDYQDDRKLVLFDCDWINSNRGSRGIKHDQYGFILVNFNHLLPPGDTLILASQAQQVFYVQDPLDEDWKVAITTKPRDLYDMPYAPHHDPCSEQNLDDTSINTTEVQPRTDVPGVTVNQSLPPQPVITTMLDTYATSSEEE